MRYYSLVHITKSPNRAKCLPPINPTLAPIMHSVHYHHCHWLPIRLCGYFTPSGRKYSNPWCHLPYPPVADNHVLPRCISTWHACHACAFDLNVSTAYFSRTRLPNLRSAPINSWMTDDIHMLFLRHNLPTDPDGSACHGTSLLCSRWRSRAASGQRRMRVLCLKEQVTCMHGLSPRGYIPTRAF